MRRFQRLRGLLIVPFALLALAAPPQPSRAADPYEINAILSLTGNGAFIGGAQSRAMQALETTVNSRGGIAGRPVKFVIKDDQSNPQVAVQLTQLLIASKVPVILGPSLAASCNAMTPLVAREGPVLYCLTSSVDPAPGGFVFSTLTSTAEMIRTSMRYFRERNWKKLAFIVTTDASGQYAEQGIVEAGNAVDNKSIQIVEREHMGSGDLSVSAQVAKIKAAAPDVLIIWVIGPPAGTVLHALSDAGSTIPIVMSSGNLTPAFIKQFGELLPREMYIPAMPYYAGSDLLDRATQNALATMSTALRAANANPDQLLLSAWDPSLAVVEALRKVGPDASAGRLRDYLVALKGWVGANGPYDFRALPQRGIGANSILMIKWDAEKGEFRPASKLGGKLLGTK